MDEIGRPHPLSLFKHFGEKSKWLDVKKETPPANETGGAYQLR
jgi:hypothetical protein